MVVDVSFLVKGPGNINTLNIPLGGNHSYKVPISKPAIGTAAFTSTGNFSQTTGTSYYTDFTINAGHQMTVTGPTTIICTGTVTIGGNGIIGATTTAAPAKSSVKDRDSADVTADIEDDNLPEGEVEYFALAPRMPSGFSGAGRSSGGNPNGGLGGGRRNSDGFSDSGTTHGGGGGANGSGRGATHAGGTRGARSLGLLTIIADSIVVSANCNFNGANGGNGVNDSNDSGAGGGGNSGYLFTFSNTFTQTAGNITANAGNGGNGVGSGGSGGGGDCGLIMIMAKTFSVTGGTIAASYGSGGTGGNQDGTDGSFLMEFGAGVVCIEGDPFRA